MPTELILPSPTEKQKLFLQADKKHVAFGGARGGGKSFAVRIKAILLCLTYPGIKTLIVRRTYTELINNHINPLRKMLPTDISKYNKTEKIFEFRNRSTIKLGYCDNDNDLQQYQGAEFDCIFLEEATNLQEVWIKDIVACLRGVNAFPKRVYYTCNPGGVSHHYIKRLFIDKQYEDGEYPEEYEFIQALVTDNVALAQTQPDYIKQLEALPSAQREAWLHGKWDIAEGRYFSEFDRNIHIVQPFPIPSHWRRYRALDYGLDATACVWVAVNEMGEAFVYKEFVQSDLIISAAARNINELTAEDEKIYETYAPPDLFSRSQESGKSRAEIFHEHGLPFIKSSNDRVAGWQSVAEWLHPIDADEGKISRLRIFSNCTELARCLPLLMRDKKNPSDCDTEPHEITHICDALRYFCSQRPVSAKPLKSLDAESEMLIEAKRRAIGGRSRGQRF